MTIPIIKPYVNSQQHMFEKRMKSIENKGIQEGSLDKLIDLLKYDRAHKKAVNKIYRQKLDNQILFQRIYSEYISFNPPILVSVGLNLVKEKIIITLYIILILLIVMIFMLILIMLEYCFSLILMIF